MNDFSSEWANPPFVPEWIKKLMTDFGEVEERPQWVPEWLPNDLRLLAQIKTWGCQGPVVRVTRERIDAFATATGDCQAIHTDEEEAKKSLFRGIVAHGDLISGLDTRALPEFESLAAYASVMREAKYFCALRPVYAGADVSMRMRVFSCHRPLCGSGVVVLYEFEAFATKGGPNEAIVLQKAGIGFGKLRCKRKRRE